MGDLASLRPLRLTVTASDPESNAPTVDDLLGQVRDFVELLREVEKAVAVDGKEELVWRVTDAHRNSPLQLEIAPFPRQHGMNIGRRDRLVRETAASGLTALRAGGERPLYFSDAALRRAERLFQRVTNGLSSTTTDFGVGDSGPQLVLTPDAARVGAATILRLQRPEDRPYREISSVEGYFQATERDGNGRALIQLRVRLTGDVVKCFVRGAAEVEVERRRIGEVWSKQQRLIVSGTVHYRGAGKMSQIDADEIRFLPVATELPSLNSIIDRDFTGGRRTEDYLEELRNGGLA